MKELSIEQKAKCYDKAINIAESKIKNDNVHIFYEEHIIAIVAELKEKTDEEMIKTTTDKIKRFKEIEKILEREKNKNV